jgi:hypothetical protein
MVGRQCGERNDWQRGAPLLRSVLEGEQRGSRFLKGEGTGSAVFSSGKDARRPELEQGDDALAGVAVARRDGRKGMKRVWAALGRAVGWAGTGMPTGPGEKEKKRQILAGLHGANGTKRFRE